MEAGHHEASWRLPESDARADFDLRHWIRLAQLAESAKFDSLFLADGPALTGTGEFRPPGQLEPLTLLTAVSQHTSRIGLIASDPRAREWMLDLKEIALGVQQEQGQVSLLLQSIHSMVNNHVQNQYSQPGYQPGYQQSGYQQGGYQQPQYQQGSGGMLQQFLGGGFGRAIMTGAGFGIGDDIIKAIF
jgi:hypothetical protein